MSTITRCPHCHVCFKANDEQLHAYQGMVRCGNCLKAFNAILEKISGHAEQHIPANSPIELMLDNEHQLDTTVPIETASFIRNKPSSTSGKWIAGIIILVLIMGFQLLFSLRHTIAQNVPAQRSNIYQACAALGCMMQPLRDISLLSIESSDLATDKEQDDVIKLNAAIRNRAHYEQALPNILLTLRNTDNKTIAQRSISPKDYFLDQETPPTILSSNSELIINIKLKLIGITAAGYQLDLFYPAD